MHSLEKTLARVWRRFPVRFAYLWGSRARGAARAGSDYDFAVSMSLRSGEIHPLLDLGTALSKALGTDEVDLVFLEDANSEIRYLVQQNGRLIFEANTEARRAYEHEARLTYWDEAIRLRRYTRAMARRIRDGKFGT